MATNEEIKFAIENRKKSHHALCSQVSVAIEKFSTADLFRYYVEEVMKGHDLCIRSYIEEKIIADLISKEKYSN